MSNSEALEQFKSITGVSDEEAKFYLDSAKGDTNAALASFFEAGANTEDGSPSMPGAYTPEATPAIQSTSSTGQQNTRGKAKGKSRPSRSGINTLGGLDQSDDDDDDDDRPAEFYTGGEKSGLGVIDPTKKKDGSKKSSNLIEEILKKAAMGGQAAEAAETPGTSFRGSGYTLGGEDEESQKVEDPNEAFRKAMAAQPAKVTRVLRLWKDGFSVDDGILYRYDDPANKEYLEAINNGRAPLALLNVAYGQPVDVNVEKRMEDAYTPPPKVYKPFEGSGHRLGSDPSPAVSQQTSATSTGAASTAPQSQQSIQTMQIDDSLPSTSLQVRLASGTRLISPFNTTHTIADVYDLIDRNEPANGGREYILLTPFPRKEYPRDGKMTLESAGLLKGVLQQKFK